MTTLHREFDYIELGAALYVPATHKAMVAIANAEKYPHLKSVVFCLEDAIKEEELHDAMQEVEQMLLLKKESKIKVFLRPRDLNNLKNLLQVKGIEKIDGFALAKFSTLNMREYFDLLNSSYYKFHLMPVFELRDLFEPAKLVAIREFLLQQKQHHIVTLRIGGEDMFKYLGIKKDCESSIHDFHVSSKVLADLLTIFKPFGFNLSAPVYNCLEHLEIFEAEVMRDVKEGLFGKTLIHPKQIAVTNACYCVTQSEYDEALLMVDNASDAIFRFENRMCEVSTHKQWAEIILRRAKIYGVISA